MAHVKSFRNTTRSQFSFFDLDICSLCNLTMVATPCDCKDRIKDAMVGYQLSCHSFQLIFLSEMAGWLIYLSFP
jgi:hypothetical protein